MREKKHEEFKLKIEKKRKDLQIIRQQMIDRQIEFLKGLQNTEKARLENQIKEKEQQAIERFQ